MTDPHYIAKPTRDDLEALAVNDVTEVGNITFASLRSHVRKACADGLIKPAISGVMIGGMRKEQCIAALLGETPAPDTTSAPKAPTLPAVPASPDNGLQAMAAMIAPYLPQTSGVDQVQLEDTVLAVIGQTHGQYRQAMEENLQNSFKAICDDVQEFKAELLKSRPVEITIRQPDGRETPMGRQHYLFPLVLGVLQSGVHAYVVSPAGSGKTSVAHHAATALEKEFRSTSFCQQSSKVDLLGYMDATGVYRSTAFRQAYEFGGVFCGDELDNGNANVIAVLNSALANDGMEFPDARVARHPDFIFVGTANTFGTGADRQYVGRNQLDAATLDRFAFIEFPYDEGFEAHLCGVPGLPSPTCDVAEGGTSTADQWLRDVQALRAAASRLKLRVVISPRASIYGKQLFEAGIGKAWIVRMLLKKGCDDATWQKLTTEAALPEWRSY